MFARLSILLSALSSALGFVVVITLTAGITAFAQNAATSPAQATRPDKTQSQVTRAATKPAAKPSVILITIDTLRADHVGCYGAQSVKTPTLDALAHDGVLFERAISQVPLTWPSHAVILTGTYPFQNGVQDFTGQPLARNFRTVSQAFQQAGYATGAVISAFVLDRSWGLARGTRTARTILWNLTAPSIAVIPMTARSPTQTTNSETLFHGSSRTTSMILR
jgi:hypothetical protein